MTILLFAGAETPQPQELHTQLELPVMSSTRELSETIRQLRATPGKAQSSSPRAAHSVEPDANGQLPIVIVPLSTGRDATSVTHAAQTLRWLRDHDGLQGIVLADPVVNDTCTIARYRKHIRRLAPQVDAVLFRAAAVNPFADAELVRRIRLAQENSASVEVALAFEQGWPTPEQAFERLGLLGVRRIAVVRADFGIGSSSGSLAAIGTVANGLDAIPEQTLFAAGSLRAAVDAAAHSAYHRYEHGEDGIDAGLLADHGQGFAHSHGEEDEPGHTHPHAHSHRHSHSHGHAHSHSHGHSHGHGHSHAAGHSHGHAHPHSHSHGDAHSHSHVHSHGADHSHPHVPY